ncbi:MAG: hypothetical protein NVSMB29_17560 [Candidatus Dormibacteria bacterium]
MASSEVIDGQLHVGGGGVFSPEPVHNLLPSGDNPPPVATLHGPTFTPGDRCPPAGEIARLPGQMVHVENLPSGEIYTEYPTLHDGETAHPFATWPNGQGGDFSVPLGTGGTPPGHFQAVTTAGVWASDSVAVDVYVTRMGSFDAQGLCQGMVLSSPDGPYDVGPLPPPVPPAAVLATPPFNPQQLAANLKRSWAIGGMATAPGAAAGNTAYVRAPTCAWITGSTVPETGATFHAYTQATVPSPRDRGNVVLTLNYLVQVTPGSPTWDFGDGDHRGAAHETGRGNDPGSNDPHFNYSTYSWDPGGCSVYHLYAATFGQPGHTITATQHLMVRVSVSWSDGTTTHGPQPVACDPASPLPGSPCDVAIGPADGWSSPGHRVVEVEGVPYTH